MVNFSWRRFSQIGGRVRLFTILSTMVLLVSVSMTPTITNARTSTANAQDPIARATAIVNQMTLDEKILEVHGVGGASPNLRIVPGISRLKIPEFVITNGSAGVSYGTITPRQPATALPAPLWRPGIQVRKMATQSRQSSSVSPTLLASCL